MFNTAAAPFQGEHPIFDRASSGNFFPSEEGDYEPLDPAGTKSFLQEPEAMRPLPASVETVRKSHQPEFEELPC